MSYRIVYDREVLANGLDYAQAVDVAMEISKERLGCTELVDNETEDADCYVGGWCMGTRVGVLR